MSDAGLSVLREILDAASGLPAAAADDLAMAIAAAPRIYVHGMGRCGLVLRTFVVRLAQLGIPVHLVGETTALAARAGDLLVVGSGSGRTSATLVIAERARGLGLDVLALTATADAPLASLAGRTIVLPGTTKHDSTVAQPPGSLFEQMLFCLLEETVLRLSRVLDPGFERIKALHANLE